MLAILERLDRFDEETVERENRETGVPLIFETSRSFKEASSDTALQNLDYPFPFFRTRGPIASRFKFSFQLVPVVAGKTRRDLDAHENLQQMRS